MITDMQRKLFSLLMFFVLLPNTLSLCDVSPPQFSISKKQMMEISSIYESRSFRQTPKPTHTVSNPISIVFFDASFLLLYRPFLNTTNACHISVCTSSLYLGPCHACVANTSVTLRSSMAAALAALRRLNVNSFVVLFDETASARFGLTSPFA